MSILTLDVGGLGLSVNCQKGGHASPRKVGGDRSYSFSGIETSATRAEAMVVPVVLAPLPVATVATIRALFALGAQIPCAGDVFNNGGGTSDWSASITDELHETADIATLSMTLYEVEPSAVTRPTTTMYLTNVVSSGSVYVLGKSPADDPFSAGIGSADLVDDVTIPTCAGPSACAPAYSAAPEAVWLLAPAVADGDIVGAPTVTVHSIGGTAEVWATQAVMFKIFVVRSGSDVAEWDTAWSSNNGGFSGGDISCTAPPVAFAGLTGDRLRVEAWGRAGLQGGAINDSNFQTISWGNVGADSHWGKVTGLGGDTETMWPPA